MQVTLTGSVHRQDRYRASTPAHKCSDTTQQNSSHQPTSVLTPLTSIPHTTKQVFSHHPASVFDSSTISLEECIRVHTPPCKCSHRPIRARKVFENTTLQVFSCCDSRFRDATHTPPCKCFPYLGESTQSHHPASVPERPFEAVFPVNRRSHHPASVFKTECGGAEGEPDEHTGLQVFYPSHRGGQTTRLSVVTAISR